MGRPDAKGVPVTTYRPKHRAPGHANTQPVQPAGRHVDSIVTRLGAAVFDVDAFERMLREAFVDNPFRRGGVR